MLDCWLWDVVDRGSMERVGTGPAKRAFYRVFRDFNLLNDLGIGYIDPLVSGLGDFSYLPLEKYRFDSAAAEWTETIEPCK